MAPVRKALTEFKSGGMARSPILRRLLDVRVDFMALEGDLPLLSLELGWRSIATRLVPVLGPYVAVKDLSFINDAGLRLFRYGPEDSAVYLHFLDNLVLASTDPRLIRAALAAKEAGEHLNGRRDLRGEALRAPLPDGGIRIVLETGALLERLAAGDPGPGRSSPASAVPGADDRRPPAHQRRMPADRRHRGCGRRRAVPRHPRLPASPARGPAVPARRGRGVLGRQPRGVPRAVPPAPGARGREPREARSGKPTAASRLLLGATVDELVFSWTGAEAGLFTVDSSPDPVLYVRIRDPQAFGRAIDRLRASPVVAVDQSLVLDGVRLSRIRLPWFLKGIVDLFQKGLETPYYLVQGDYFFLSVNPAHLARLHSELRANRLLIGSKSFSALSGGKGMDASVLLYYDLDRSVPFFLEGGSMPADILRLYGQGVATLRARGGRLEAEVRARRVERQGTAPYPGFPRPLGVTLAGDVTLKQFGRGTVPLALYADAGGDLHVSDLQGSVRASARCEKGVTAVPGEGRAFFAWSPAGTVYRIDEKAGFVAPFPLAADLKGSFPPLVHRDRLVTIRVRPGRSPSWTRRATRRTGRRPFPTTCSPRPPSGTAGAPSTRRASRSRSTWPTKAGPRPRAGRCGRTASPTAPRPWSRPGASFPSLFSPSGAPSTSGDWTGRAGRGSRSRCRGCTTRTPSTRAFRPGEERGSWP
jgi:hypothetical protein